MFSSALIEGPDVIHQGLLNFLTNKIIFFNVFSKRILLHHESKKLVANFDVVAIEDLNMKGMSQALHFGKSVADNGWGMFTSFLAYKLNEQGKQLVKIDKWFPSTKTCSSCGNVKNMTLSERVYSCIYGVNFDRDYNATINIKNEAIRLLALA